MLYSIQAHILRRGTIVKRAARISTARKYLQRVVPLSDYVVRYWDPSARQPYRVTAEEFLRSTAKETPC